MWLCEQITGNRKTYGMNLIGGVRRDITPELKPKILEVVDGIEKEWLKVIDAIGGDTPLMMRLKGIGVLKHSDAVDFCVTGPTARGSGVKIDSRVDHPYSAFDLLVPEKKVQDGGDNLARTLVRLAFRPVAFRNAVTSALNVESRSRITYRYGEASGNASRNCWTTQSAVGCRVTLKCRILRRPCAMTKKQ